MRKLLFVFPALVLFTVSLLISAPGCGPKASPPPAASPTTGAASPASPSPTGAKTAIKAGDGKITGKIVFAGAIPDETILDAIKAKPECVAPNAKENMNQKWLVGKDKGVSNVVVYLKTPANSYFEPSDEDKKRQDMVEMDQPFCAFIPHVIAVYPQYFDGKKHKESGQKLKVKNSSSLTHNTKINGDALAKNFMDLNINSKDEKVVTLNYQKKPIDVNCNVHPWMAAMIWVFDHPYHAVTKDDGTFEIKNVPVGQKLEVEIWHETGVVKTVEVNLKAGGEEKLGDISAGK